MQHPADYPHRILLVVLGLTPQIVTETLYKLAVESKTPFVPTEIHLITTEKGDQSARVSLLGLGDDTGQIALLQKDYQLPDIAFTPEHIHTIPDTAEDFTTDAASREHNVKASDFITNKIKSFTADDNSALHVSLAGGRKTMSYYAGYALSLYGRIQDRLSHVMVNEPFQSNRDFFFPPLTPRSYETDNRWYSTSDARVVLSDIPYVRLHYHVPRRLLAGDTGFGETVSIIQRFLAPPHISADLESETIIINQYTVKLDRARFVMYLWLCARCKQGQGPVNKDEPGIINSYLLHYKHFYGDMGGMYERAENAQYKICKTTGERLPQTEEQKRDREKRWLAPHRSHINGELKELFGERLAKPFMITVGEKDDVTGYLIDLPAEAIDIPFNPEPLA